MTRIQTLLLLPALAAAVVACQPGGPETPAPAPESRPAESAAPAASEEVEYEPAYPADVNSEGLSEEDVAQQDSSHSHGGDEHSHGDGDHTHGEEDHSHGEDEDHGGHDH